MDFRGICQHNNNINDDDCNNKNNIIAQNKSHHEIDVVQVVNVVWRGDEPLPDQRITERQDRHCHCGLKLIRRLDSHQKEEVLVVSGGNTSRICRPALQETQREMKN